ncbi:pentatricopeptide repeat-containing protein [Striga asiatica]|uniref:Pentatricopeptide repeat-containing protein n=1 Tax=Striga asiatica TaxID=4170 RepID=A0A5A7RF61_STRAF|nr:pentatricopeptide repeat-containing protein [Striga asiatica]
MLDRGVADLARPGSWQKMGLFMNVALIYGSCNSEDIEGADCCFVGKIDSCLELWELMRSKNSRNTFSFNIMMKGFLDNGRVDENALGESDVLGDAYAYSSMIYGAFITGLIDASIFEE